MSEPIRCPTCGCPVKVGGEGATHYYIPVQDPDVKRLVEAAQEAVGELGMNGSLDDLEAALAPFEEAK